MCKRSESVIRIKSILKYKYGIELSKSDEEQLITLPPEEAKTYLRKLLAHYKNGYVKCPPSNDVTTETKQVQLNQPIITIRKTIIPYDRLSIWQKMKYHF